MAHKYVYKGYLEIDILENNIRQFLTTVYRVAHLLRERNMLTSNFKFRWWPGSGGKLTAKRNFKFGVNIILSRSRWATLYSWRDWKVITLENAQINLN